MTENLFGLVIYVLVALFMISMGISQLKSKKPVGFYSGEKPPKAEDLKDVESWNKKHGRMWILYGVFIMISYCGCLLIGDSIWCIIPAIGGLLLPLCIMIPYHEKLKKEYLR